MAEPVHYVDYVIYQHNAMTIATTIGADVDHFRWIPTEMEKGTL